MQELLDLAIMVQKFAECGTEKVGFIVSEWVQIHVSPNNSRVMSALTFLLLRLNTLQKKLSNFESADAMV